MYEKILNNQKNYPKVLLIASFSYDFHAIII